MPDVYISRAGMETKRLDEKFTQTELSTLKDDLVKVEQASQMKDDRIRHLEESMRLLQQNLDAVTQALSLKPTIPEIETALRRKSSQTK